MEVLIFQCFHSAFIEYEILEVPMSNKVIFVDLDRVLRTEHTSTCIERRSLYALEYLVCQCHYDLVLTVGVDSMRSVNTYLPFLEKVHITYKAILGGENSRKDYKVSAFGEQQVLEDFSKGWAIQNWLTEHSPDDYLILDTAVNLGCKELNSHLFTIGFSDDGFNAEAAIKISAILGECYG